MTKAFLIEYHSSRKWQEDHQTPGIPSVRTRNITSRLGYKHVRGPGVEESFCKIRRQYSTYLQSTGIVCGSTTTRSIRLVTYSRISCSLALLNVIISHSLNQFCGQPLIWDKVPDNAHRRIQDFLVASQGSKVDNMHKQLELGLLSTMRNLEYVAIPFFWHIIEETSSPFLIWLSLLIVIKATN